MPEALFEDLPILADLGASLREGMARAEAAAAPVAAASPRRRRPRFGWLGSVFVLGLVGTAAAAGTLTLLRGSPIPGPKTEDTQASMSPRSDSLKVLDLRAPDPDGGQPPFALRVGESEAGQTCATVGQIDGNDFGIVGADGRFRELAPGIVDGCGDSIPGDATVLGARIFEAKRWEDVRTVVYGIAPDARAGTLRIRGARTPLSVDDGKFVAVVRGYPEDSALAIRLEFANHPARSYPLGNVPSAILDAGGPAWTVNVFGWSPGPRRSDRDCVSFGPVRPSSFNIRAAPTLCDVPKIRKGARTISPRRDYLISARSFRKGDRGGTRSWRWRWSSHDRRAIWGLAKPAAFKRVVITDATGTYVVRRIGPGGVFGVLLPPAPAGTPTTVTLVEPSGRRIVRHLPGTWKGVR